MDTKVPGAHLTDAELFGLALPPAGEPEALPAHLSECGACGRALQAWKTAVRDLAREGAEPIDRRTPAEWKTAGDRTLAAIRSAGSRRRFRCVGPRGSRPLFWQPCSFCRSGPRSRAGPLPRRRLWNRVSCRPGTAPTTSFCTT